MVQWTGKSMRNSSYRSPDRKSNTVAIGGAWRVPHGPLEGKGGGMPNSHSTNAIGSRPRSRAATREFPSTMHAPRARLALGRAGSVVAFGLVAASAFGGARAAETEDSIAPIAVGVLQHDDRHTDRVRAAGVTHTVLEVAWSRFEPAPGRFDERYIQQVESLRRQRRAAGFHLSLDLGIQYPPGWVRDLPNGRYVNQYGDVHHDPRPGCQSANAVFGRAVREAIARYVARVREAFGDDFVLIRLGWGHYGELNYPHPDAPGGKNAYWSFCDAAQGRAPDALAVGQVPCPTPGWRPGDPSPNREAARFAEWHLEALRNYHDGQIALMRGLYPDTPLAMLYPSWGIRPGQLDAAVAGRLAGDTPAEKNGEVQRALDFARCIAGIDDPHVVVYVTWVDSDPAFGDDAGQNPAGWSPPHWLSWLAARHPLRLSMQGENTGGGGREALRRTVERARRYRLRAVYWAFEPQLLGPEPPTLDELVPAFRAPATPSLDEHPAPPEGAVAAGHAAAVP